MNALVIAVTLCLQQFLLYSNVPSPHDIIAALQSSRERVTNISTTYRIRTQYHFDGNAETKYQNDNVYQVFMDDMGRMKYVRTGYDSAITGKKMDDQKVVGIFDLEQFKEYTVIDNKLSVGRIANSPPSDVIGHTPFDFIWNESGDPIASILKQDGVSHIEKTKTEGTIEVYTNPNPWTDSPNIEGRYRFVINLDMGFSIIRREIMRRIDGSEWIVYGSTVASDYRQHRQNFWFPSHIVIEGYDADPKAGRRSIFMRTIIDIETLEINQDVDESTFDLSYPEGTTLKDNRTGKILKVVNQSSASPNEIALDGKEYYIQEEKANQSYQFWLTAGIVFGLILFVIAGYFIVRHRHRTTVE